MNRVAKYPILGLNQDDDDSSLTPGWCREIHNAIPTKGGYGKPGGIQNIPGTVQRSNGSLPSGVNTCIGQFTDRANNRIFYFLYNGSGSHSIWYFSPNSNTHTRVLRTSYLGFSLSHPITGCDSVEGILTWADGNSEDKCIVVADAVAGLYNFSSQDQFDKQTGLYKIRPNSPPTVSRLANGSITTNNISADSFQFCARLVYRDNSVSLPGPLSKLSKADIYPSFNGANNYIRVTQAIDSSLLSVTKKIQWFYIKNNIGDYSLFAESTITSASSYSIDFYNTESVEVVPVSDVQAVNFIPNKSKSVVIHEQRVIATMDQYDYEDAGNFTFTVTTQNVTPGSGGYQCHLPGTSSTYGIVFFDKYGRTNGVVQKATVSFPKQYSTGQSLSMPNSPIPIRATWSVSGTPPSWAETASIVMKKNNTVSSYAQALVDVFFYKRESSSVSLDIPTEFEDDGKVFYRTRQNVSSRNIYLRLPSNIPVSVSSDYYVRLLNNNGQTKDVEPIIEVIGNKIICGNFGISDWTSKNCLIYVQIEKYSSNQQDLYFEIGEHFNVSSGFSTTSGTLRGDQWYVGFGFTYDKTSSGIPSYSSIPNLYPGLPSLEVFVASPSPTSSVNIIDTTNTSVERIKVPSNSENSKAVKLFGKLGKLIDKKSTETIETNISSVARTYSLDYNKIASDFGRPWPEVNNKRINYEPNTLTISDKYVFNSQLNGMSRFTNFYTLPPSRTPIRKLQNIGASNILLAIHERSVTSLASYSGDNILHTTDGAQILGDGKSIFGYDRELMGGYGTIYPGSVQEHNGKVFFFDAYQGEVVRYGANGLTPIGSIYKMKTFFKLKGDQFVNTTGRNVISGYDTNLDIYYLTFKSTTPSENITIAFVNKEGQERWISFGDYVPERYANINNRLFSFVSGVMLEHNASSTYGNFNGVQYSMSIKHPFSTEFSHPKLLRNISTESTSAWSSPSITVAKANGTTQETSLTAGSFKRRDDVFYADLKRDKNTPTALLPAGKSGLTAGSPLIGKVYQVELSNDSTELETIDIVNYGYIDSPGHRIV